MNVLVVDAFTLYWAMGEGRSLENLSRCSGVPLPVLCGRFVAERWDRRLVNLERELTFAPEQKESFGAFEKRLCLLVEFMKGKAAEGMLRFGDTPDIQVSRVTAGSRVVLMWEMPKRGVARHRTERRSQ